VVVSELLPIIEITPYLEGKEQKKNGSIHHGLHDTFVVLFVFVIKRKKGQGVIPFVIQTGQL